MTTKYTPPLLVITGPTATGKTKLAAMLGSILDGEVISADSRQVYRGMDIGSGKDQDDYVVDGLLVPYHLVDIVNPGYEYSVFEYQQDFLKAYRHILSRGKQPILCGGTGMYIEAVISGYNFREVPVNEELRKELSFLTMDELAAMLATLRPLHNTTDTDDRNRLIRAVEIAVFDKENPNKSEKTYPDVNPIIFAVHFERSQLRERITERLIKRLDEGMITEVDALLNKGLQPEQLTFYGLEYKYVTQYVTGIINKEEMVQKLNTAIHQFAKRQMTWFRRMEKKGHQIIWIDGSLPLEEKVGLIAEHVR